MRPRSGHVCEFARVKEIRWNLESKIVQEQSLDAGDLAGMMIELWSTVSDLAGSEDARRGVRLEY